MKNYYFLLLLFILFLPANFYLLAQSNYNVSIVGTSFSPDNLTVFLNDTVTWTNTSGSHNVNGTLTAYPDNPEGFGNDVGSGWEFSHVFTLAGSYDYHCDPHLGIGMTGIVHVVEPASITLNFSEMNPHIDQLFKVYLFDTDAEAYVDSLSLDPITEANFMLAFENLVPGKSFNIDFYADFNGNSQYDAPPADHAWRITLENLAGDSTLNFAHNTNFTDIMEAGEEPTSIAQQVSGDLAVFPNPVSDMLSFSGKELANGPLTVELFDTRGQLVAVRTLVNQKGINQLNIQDIPEGMYYLKVTANEESFVTKIVKQNP